MDSRKDYYAVLGIRRNEAGEGIQAAYRRLAKAYHPDRAGDQGTQKFQEIQEAYEVLSDPTTRKDYDERTTTRRWRAPEDPEPLVRGRAVRMPAPEPLVREPLWIDGFPSAAASLCPFCRSPRGSPCRFCLLSVLWDRTMKEWLAHDLLILSRRWSLSPTTRPPRARRTSTDRRLSA